MDGVWYCNSGHLIVSRVRKASLPRRGSCRDGRLVADGGVDQTGKYFRDNWEPCFSLLETGSYIYGEKTRMNWKVLHQN